MAKYIFIILLACVSCSSEKPLQNVSRETLYNTQFIRDTINVYERTHESVKNDTLIIERERRVYIERVNFDTLLINKCDTIYIEKVAAKSGGDRLQRVKDWVLIFVLFFLFAYFAIKKLGVW